MANWYQDLSTAWKIWCEWSHVFIVHNIYFQSFGAWFGIPHTCTRATLCYWCQGRVWLHLRCKPSALLSKCHWWVKHFLHLIQFHHQGHSVWSRGYGCRPCCLPPLWKLLMHSFITMAWSSVCTNSWKDVEVAQQSEILWGDCDGLGL